LILYLYLYYAETVPLLSSHANAEPTNPDLYWSMIF
jgi:hypothetical protein